MIAPIDQPLDYGGDTYGGDTVAHAEEILRELDPHEHAGVSLQNIQRQLGNAIAKNPVPFVMAAIAMGLTFGFFMKRIGR